MRKRGTLYSTLMVICSTSYFVLSTVYYKFRKITNEKHVMFDRRCTVSNIFRIQRKREIPARMKHYTCPINSNNLGCLFANAKLSDTPGKMVAFRNNSLLPDNSLNECERIT